MLAYHIESQLFGFNQVVFHRLFGRSRIKAVRPPALVEGTELEKGFAVKGHALVACGIGDRRYLAEGDVPLHAIDFLSAAEKGKAEPVKIRMGGAPELRSVEGESGRFTRFDGDAGQNGSCGRVTPVPHPAFEQFHTDVVGS